MPGAQHIIASKGKYDVAFINNLENDAQKQFLGIFKSRKKTGYSLRFVLGKSMCRGQIINCSAAELARPKSHQLARHYTQEAISTAIRDGARIILFAAGTKRLFSEDELDEIKCAHPGVTFTIGDNGTALAMLADVLGAIRRRNIRRESKIAILGPNGFLGETVTRFLQAQGYSNLLLLSSSVETPFVGVAEVELIIACSHHSRLRLTAEIMERISDGKAYVIDVCRPSNLSRKEFMKCSNVARQDSGMVHNANIRYVFPWAAKFVLRRLGLSTQIMYGCFGEAVALSVLPQEELARQDFMRVSDEAMRLMGRAYTQAGFSVAPIRNYGNPTGAGDSLVQWEVVEYLD